MTKEKILKIFEKLIEDEKEAIEQYHDAIQKLSDSPRIVSELGHIYEEETRHITELNELVKCIENHDNEKNRVLAMYSDNINMYDDGIVIDEKEGD